MRELLLWSLWATGASGTTVVTVASEAGAAVASVATGTTRATSARLQWQRHWNSNKPLLPQDQLTLVKLFLNTNPNEEVQEKSSSKNRRSLTIA